MENSIILLLQKVNKLGYLALDLISEENLLNVIPVEDNKIFKFHARVCMKNEQLYVEQGVEKLNADNLHFWRYKVVDINWDSVDSNKVYNILNNTYLHLANQIRTNLEDWYSESGFTPNPERLERELGLLGLV